MLKTLRQKKLAKKIFIFLAIVIIPAFVLWGSAAMIKSQKIDQYAGKMYGRRVSFQDYRDSLLACRNQALLRYGENFSSVEQYLNLNQQAWQRLILLAEAGKNKIRIPDADVIKAIQNTPIFVRSGKFDYKIYQTIVKYSLGIPERRFEEEMRGSLIIEKLYEKLTLAITVTDEDALKKFKEANEKCNIEYVQVPTSEFEKQITIPEAEIKVFYENNKAMLKEPFAMNIQFITIPYPVSTKPEDKQSVDKKMLDIYAKLSKQPDIEKVAEEFSLSVKETGLSGMNDPMPGLEKTPEILNAAFSLKDGAFSKPINTDKASYILRLKESKQSYIPVFEKAKTHIEEMLRNQKAKELARQKANKTYESLKEIFDKNANADFASALSGLGLKPDSLKDFTRLNSIPGADFSQKINDDVFALKKGQISQPQETEKGFYIIRLKELLEIDRGEFETKKDELKKSLLDSKKMEAFDAYLKNLTEKAKLEVNYSK